MINTGVMPECSCRASKGKDGFPLSACGNDKSAKLLPKSREVEKIQLIVWIPNQLLQVELLGKISLSLVSRAHEEEKNGN